jgi:aminotransferase
MTASPSSHVARREQVAAIVGGMPSSAISRGLELLSSTPGVISLAVGQPDFPTPARIAQAGVDSMLNGDTGYTSSFGTLPLRELLGAHLERLYDVSYSPNSELLLTSGVSEALDVAVRALVDPGDEVLVPEPCYVAYPAVVAFAGARCIGVPTKAEDGFVVRIEELRARLTPATKAILLGYPSNPTGAVPDRDTMLALAAFAAENHLLVISDEVYDRLVYGVEHICFASLPNMRERTVLLGGFSKSYAMTGWRLGYVAAPEPLLDAISKIHQNVMLAAPTAAQAAAVEALTSGEADVRAMLAEYDRRRQMVHRRLNEIGLPTVEPRGAFYAFADIRGSGIEDDASFAQQLFTSERVAVAPGSVFGPSGRGFVRISYAASLESLQEALIRIERFLSSLRT